MKKTALLSLLLVIAVMAAYHGLLYFDNQFKYGRMRETPSIRPHEAPLPIMEKGLVPVSGGEAMFRAVEGSNLVSPLADVNPSEIAQGQRLYFNFCAQCHGKNHDGNGTVGQSFHPLPGDLRSKKIQFLADGIIFKEISYGIPEGRQPPLATTISIEDRWRIIAYLKSLGPRP